MIFVAQKTSPDFVRARFFIAQNMNGLMRYLLLTKGCSHQSPNAIVEVIELGPWLIHDLFTP
jgi:hypothetical protein